ncbi:MAG: tripartite tricarboxylate transporter substrate-binding protein [Proteobacteria bacterium]|nr:tripartite tricarboxylate transporter substrate-binding protein [Pseudomonadota bacterium]
MQRAYAALGQPIIVENRPGARGLIAFEACSKADPDGYTLCLGTGEAMSFNPSLFAKLPYDAGRDFERPDATGPYKGSGFFLHDDPLDRPADRFGGAHTIHTGGARCSSLLLPFIGGPA